MGASHTCHACTGVKSRLLIFAGCLFGLIALFFLVLALVFLIGGLDAVEGIRQSISRTMSISGGKATSSRSGRGGAAKFGEKTSSMRSTGVAVVPMLNTNPPGGGEEAKQDFKGSARGVSFDNAVSVEGVEPASAGGRGYLLDAGAQLSDTTVGGSEAGGEAKTRCCGLGDKIKRWASKLPTDKLKILVVVWQILTVFPSVTGVEFPSVYSRFLSWINVVNLDVGQIFAASCMLPAVNFYHRLLLTTLAPIGLALVLVVTYWMAKRRAGIGSAGIVARRAAWSRHMAAGLLLTFLVSLAGCVTDGARTTVLALVPSIFSWALCRPSGLVLSLLLLCYLP